MSTPSTSHHQDADTRHRESVAAVEFRRLERHLRAFGPMPRHRLAATCGADHWHEGTFDQAVRAGINSGHLRELPLGWIEAVDPADSSYK